MKITDEKIEEFRKIYKEEYGEEISREEAYERAVKLLQLMKIAYRPFRNKEEYEEFLVWKRNRDKVD